MDWQYIILWMKYSACAGAFLILTYTAYTLTSLYYNIKISKEQFSTKRLLTGVLKLLVLVVSGAILCFTVIALPPFIRLVGIPIPDEFASGINATAMILIYITTACKYFIKAKDNYTEIIESKTSEKDEIIAG